jgi:DNA-binding MarR family transcriptional regulator
VELPEIPLGTRARIRYHAGHALDKPPDIQWLIQGLIPASSVTLIVGQPGSKKTLLALDLAVSVALGQPWLGLPVTQAPALYVDEEAGVQAFWRRANAAISGPGDRETPFHFISPGSYDLRNLFDSSELSHQLNEVDAKLLVIDALAEVSGGDETSLQSVQALFKNLRFIAVQHRAAVILIHHTNKSGIFRGASSLSASVDLMLSIESPHSSSHIHLYPLKSRDVVPPPIHAQVNFAEGRFWLSASQDLGLKKLNPHELAILTQIRDEGEVHQKDLMDLNTGSPGTLRKYLHQLRMAGFIQRVNQGGRGSPAILALTAKGEDHVSQS